MINYFKNYYFKNKKIILALTTCIFLVGVFAFNVFVVNYNALPDGPIEGLHYYHNAHWHLMNGRWAIRYLNVLIGNNLVMPFIIVFFSCIIAIITALLLKEAFNIKSVFPLCIVASLLLVNPSFISCLTYPHIALSFIFALFFAVLYFYLGTLKQANKYLISFLMSICLAIALGLYQSYIGAAVFLVLCSAFFDLNKMNFRDFSHKYLRYLCTGILGTLLDVLIYNCEIFFRGLGKAERILTFSFKSIFSSLPDSIISCYKTLIKYFMDGMMYRKYLYFLLFVVGILLLVYYFVNLDKKRLIPFNIIILLLMPLALNIIKIIIPYNVIYLLMQQHYALLFVFLLVLYEKTEKTLRCIKFYTIVEVIILSTYVISANATYTAIKISYDTLNSQTQMILYDLNRFEEYSPNQSRVIIVGFPSESTAQNNLEVYRYAIGLRSNQAFWEDYNGVSLSWRNYLLNYFGVDIGYFSVDEYNAIIYSDEYNEMPIWPATGSIKTIDSFVVVKLTNDVIPSF